MTKLVVSPFLKSRDGAGSALVEAVQAQSEKHEAQNKALKESARASTFVSTGRASSRNLRVKQLRLTEAYNLGMRQMITGIIRESLPFDLSHISDAELNEQIIAVKDQYSSIINEAAIFAAPEAMPTGVDVNSPNSVSLHLGSLAGVGSTAKSIARKVASTQAATIAANREANISIGHNILDTAIVYGNEHPTLLGGKEDIHKQFANIFCSVFGKTAKAIGGKIRGNIAANLSRDADKKLITADDVNAGLSEGTVALRKLHEQRKTPEFSLLEETFKNVSLLQETSGATQDDYLNEAVFHAAVLEAYSLLGCVEKTSAEISVEMYKLRQAFAK